MCSNIWAENENILWFLSYAQGFYGSDQLFCKHFMDSLFCFHLLLLESNVLVSTIRYSVSLLGGISEPLQCFQFYLMSLMTLNILVLRECR